MKIGIAIATYNSGGVIERCLQDLSNERFTVVLFDDASTDQTVKLARRVCPSVRILTGDGNAWWGGGTAKAVEE